MATLLLLACLCGFLDVSGSLEDGLEGGWRLPTAEELRLYSTDKCSLERISINEITAEKFKDELASKPFILTFPNGLEEWCTAVNWTSTSLLTQYGERELTAGKSIDIVYNGGKGSMNRTFAQFVDEMRQDRAHSDLT